MKPRDVTKLAKDLQGKSAAAVDEELCRRHLDPESRIAVKHEIAAAASHRRISAMGEMAHNHAEWRQEHPLQPMNEIERLMQRAGLQPGMQYTEADIEEGCRRAGITDTTQKLAVKLEAETRGMLKPWQAAQDSRRLHGKSMQAAAAPAGKVLLNVDGTTRTLRFS